MMHIVSRCLVHIGAALYNAIGGRQSIGSRSEARTSINQPANCHTARPLQRSPQSPVTLGNKAQIGAPVELRRQNKNIHLCDNDER